MTSVNKVILFYLSPLTIASELVSADQCTGAIVLFPHPGAPSAEQDDNEPTDYEPKVKSGTGAVAQAVEGLS